MSAGRRLVRALEASAAAAGCSVRVTAAGERPWSSATFVGARHALVIEGEPATSLAAWLERLPDMRLAVPGHVVAELAVERQTRGARLSALMLEGCG